MRNAISTSTPFAEIESAALEVEDRAYLYTDSMQY